MKGENKMNVQHKVFQNSLETCEYISGYKNASSTIRVKCLIHNYEFETKFENVRKDGKKHHICPLCQQEDRTKTRVKVECAYCKQNFFVAPSKLDKSKSGLYFCCREHKDLAQRIDSGQEFDIMRPTHYGTKVKDYRQIAFSTYEHKCSACGWNEDERILEVHHIDSNRENNEIDNLVILCPTCHRKITLHYYKLIDRELLIPIE